MRFTQDSHKAFLQELDFFMDKKENKQKTHKK